MLLLSPGLKGFAFSVIQMCHADSLSDLYVSQDPLDNVSAGGILDRRRCLFVAMACVPLWTKVACFTDRISCVVSRHTVEMGATIKFKLQDIYFLGD